MGRAFSGLTRGDTHEPTLRGDEEKELGGEGMTQRHRLKTLTVTSKVRQRLQDFDYQGVGLKCWGEFKNKNVLMISLLFILNSAKDVFFRLEITQLSCLLQIWLKGLHLAQQWIRGVRVCTLLMTLKYMFNSLIVPSKRLMLWSEKYTTNNW